MLEIFLTLALLLIAAALACSRRGPVDLRRQILPAVLSFGAAFAGSKRVPSIPTVPMTPLLPGVLIGFVLLAGHGILKATAHTKLLNFAPNTGSLLAFALAGAPRCGPGLAMGLAQAAGAQPG